MARIWRAHGLKPHLARTFKLSTDPKFVEKLRDVVGLYADPPERAVVFAFDEKSRIQALDRTQPELPLKKGRCGTMTHDYKRHGTTTHFSDNTLGKVRPTPNPSGMLYSAPLRKAVLLGSTSLALTQAMQYGIRLPISLRPPYRPSKQAADPP